MKNKLFLIFCHTPFLIGRPVSSSYIVSAILQPFFRISLSAAKKRPVRLIQTGILLFFFFSVLLQDYICTIFRRVLAVLTVIISPIPAPAVFFHQFAFA